MLTVSLSHLAYGKLYSLYAHCLKIFHHKQMLNFVKNFFCIFWNDHMVFILQFITSISYALITLWLICRYLKIHASLSNKYHLIVVYYPSDVLLGLVCYFIKDFWISVHWCTDRQLFFVISLILVSGWCWPYRMSLEVFLPLQFLGSLRKINVSSFLNVW